MRLDLDLYALGINDYIQSVSMPGGLRDDDIQIT